MRYFFEIAFNGKPYHGWQIQENAITVQQIVQEKLQLIHKNEKPTVTGCGRTDAGVHAEQFFFHVDIPPISNLDKYCFQMNNMLPIEIQLKQIHLVKEDAHARFDALSRTYEYRFSTLKSPFNSGFVTYISEKINVNNMNECCQMIKGKHDFTSFSKTHTDVNHFFCEILEAEWVKKDEQIIFRVKANRFLRNMVRALVGTMVLVGKEKISSSDFKKIMMSKDRTKAGPSAKAHGLFLTNIAYSNHIYVQE
ncbi:MAG: tRNA pseudouridine(38-40) synthase TruA [Bacteroidota bacterium]|nr:tRNA pseudouridine(38-40) synthase TruA [Bacteroidota bacterium]